MILPRKEFDERLQQEKQFSHQECTDRVELVDEDEKQHDHHEEGAANRLRALPDEAWEEVFEDVPAVESGHREEIEQKEHHVEFARVEEHLPGEFGSQIEFEADEAEHGESEGEREIGRGSGEGRILVWGGSFML